MLAAKGFPTPASRSENNPTGKSAKTCPAPSQKIFRFSDSRESLSYSRRPAPRGGALAIVTDVGRDAVDADGAFDERRLIADGEVVWS